MKGSGKAGSLRPRWPMDAVDRDFDALPAAPRGRRVLALTFIAAAWGVSVAILLLLRADVAYLFASRTPADLGEAHVIQPAALDSGAFVRVSGTPMASKTVFFRHPLDGETFAIFPLAGQRNVFVQMSVGAPEDVRRSSRREFAGRLVTFGELGGRLGSVREYLRNIMHLPVTGETFVLMADEAPGTPGAPHFVALLCFLCAAVNAWMAVRWFRPGRAK